MLNNHKRARRLFTDGKAFSELDKMKNEPTITIIDRVNNLQGFVDGIRNGRVEGWAFDEADPLRPVALTLLVDGETVRTFQACSYRGDLQHLGTGTGMISFSETIPRRYFNGLFHEVSVIFEASERLVEGSPSVAALDKYLVKEARGNIDVISSAEIGGWGLDVHNPSEPLLIELLANNVVLAQTTANRMRDDLKAAGLGSGAYGFRFSTPLSLLDDQDYRIAVRVVGTEIILSGGCNFRASSNRPYKTFKQYLAWSLHYHEIYPPFAENDKCVIAEMIWLSDHYYTKYQESDQDALVSIIMPTFNRAHLIREAINSILKQDYSNFELIIVDDHSSDQTYRVVKSYKDHRITYIESELNLGPSASRARGLAVAKGEFFAYLDSDNTWDSRYLTIMINTLKNSPERDTAYCAQLVQQLTPGGEPKKIIRYSAFSRAVLENQNFIDLNCFVHTRRVFEAAGSFRTDIRMLEDWDLILRYTERSNPIAVPCLLSNYYFGKSSNQVSFDEDYAGTLEVVRNALGRTHLDLQLPVELLIEIGVSEGAIVYELNSERRIYSKARFVSIIIPSYEAGIYLQLCLDSIAKFTPLESYEVIIVDNASVGTCLDVINNFERNPNCKIIRNMSNMGYTHAVNQGIRIAAPGSDVILMNNDILVTPGWLEAFWEVRDVISEPHLIVPRQTLLPRAATMDVHVPSCNPQIEVDVNLSAHHLNVVDPLLDEERGYMQLSFAAFFCVYIPRECIEVVGGLDHKNGRHYRSDVIFCDVAQYLTGCKIIYTPHAKLYHFLQRATTHLKEADAAIYKLMFVQNKWGSEEPFQGLI